MKGKTASSAVGARLPPHHARPALGVQVTIQSEQEKQLKKYFRKEEKKMAKQMKELEAMGVEDHATQLQLLGFDPAELRKER